MKISEILYEQCLKKGETSFFMHHDATDCLMNISNPRMFDEVRSLVLRTWGDVEVELKMDGHWSERITILDEKWRTDYERYIESKAAWCEKYGCD